MKAIQKLEYVDISYCDPISVQKELDEKLKENDFGKVVLFQTSSFKFASFGLYAGVGALLSMVLTLFFFGIATTMEASSELTLFIILTAIGIPFTAYLMSRITDIPSGLRKEKSLSDYFSTVGFSLWGGLLGGIISISLFTLYFGWDILLTFDAVVFGLPLGQAIGRLGCLNYGCCYGKTCSHSLGIRYNNSDTKILRQHPFLKNVSVFPTQILSAIANVIIFMIMLTVLVTHPELKVGSLSATYLILYGIKRFTVEFLRDESPRIEFLKLTIWQWFSLGFILAGLVLSNYLKNTELYHFNGFINGLTLVQFELIPVFIFTLIITLAYSLHGKELGSW